MVDQFVAALSLKGVPAKKLTGLLQPTSGMMSQRSSTASAQPQAQMSARMLTSDVGGDPSWDPNQPAFYFLPAATILQYKPGGLRRMQELRDAHELVRLPVDLTDAFRGRGLIKSILFVSQYARTYPRTMLLHYVLPSTAQCYGAVASLVPQPLGATL
jgi:hypothetical protein